MNLFSFFISLIFTYVNVDADCSVVTTIEDRRKTNSSFRLVQYNAEWLFIDYCSSSQCPGSGCSWHTIDEATTHLKNIANVLNDLKPDIVNICEVEGCNELNILIDELGDTSYKPYLVKGTDTSTGQNVGMITRVDPIINLYRSEEHVNYPLPNSNCNSSLSGITGLSKHYITEIIIFEIKIAIIGVHLLAIPTDPNRCIQREGQAQILQNIVYSYISKNYEIIVLGDMNDYDMETLDVNMNKPISRVLNIIKGIDGDKKGTYILSNIADFISKTERYSDWWDSDNNCNTMSEKDYSMIDHVLVSPLLKKYIKDVFIYHNYLEYCGKMDSDHYPVVVDLEFA